MLVSGPCVFALPHAGKACSLLGRREWTNGEGRRGWILAKKKKKTLRRCRDAGGCHINRVDPTGSQFQGPCCPRHSHMPKPQPFTVGIRTLGERTAAARDPTGGTVESLILPSTNNTADPVHAGHGLGCLWFAEYSFLARTLPRKEPTGCVGGRWPRGLGLAAGMSVF